jgi:hypothetical protein
MLEFVYLDTKKWCNDKKKTYELRDIGGTCQLLERDQTSEGDFHYTWTILEVTSGTMHPDRPRNVCLELVSGR